jgi:hypothetical protein
VVHGRDAVKEDDGADAPLALKKGGGSCNPTVAMVPSVTLGCAAMEVLSRRAAMEVLSRPVVEEM